MVTPASFIVGYSVISTDTLGLGEIVDALVTTDGHVPYAVVEFDSVLGVSQAQSLIPMNALSVNAGNATATIDIVEEELEGIPMFEPGELPDTSRSGWDEEFREYWANLHTDLQEIYSEDVATIESIELVEQPEAMPISAFTSFRVFTENGARIGDVEDVAIDLIRGRAPYLILGVGGFLDIGDTNLAVPFESFAWDPDDARLVTGLSAETLQNAPGFEEDEWPLTGNPELEIEMNDYWSKEFGG
jgi:sporulation protein YlmC with PRC-barrel domain